MLLILIGPSCSGKSTIARIIAHQTGASVWTGKDYLRLDKNEPQAWSEFQALLLKAASDPDFSRNSIMYVVTEISSPLQEIISRCNTTLIKFYAPLETLEERFAPRVGGKISPPLSAMLKRALVATREINTHLEFDTSQTTPEQIVSVIVTGFNIRPKA